MIFALIERRASEFKQQEYLKHIEEFVSATDELMQEAQAITLTNLGVSDHLYNSSLDSMLMRNDQEIMMFIMVLLPLKIK